MGDFNLTVILDAIRRTSGGLSRVELAQIVGLSPQTISNISRRLLDQNLIVEAGKEGSGPGKPRTILRLNPGGMYALGVHLDPAVTTFVVLDLVGAVVRHSRIKTPGGTDPSAVIATIAAEIAQLVEDSGVDRSRIAGLGVAAPGPIDLDNGTVVDPPLLPGWDRVELRDALARATGYSVLVDKDVTSAAVAETWAGGPSGAGSFIFMYMGTGIGCGIVLNDEVVRGTSGNAGEIGHIVVDPDGPVCDCGQRGCVKSSAIPQVLVAEAEAAGILQGPAAGSAAEIQQSFSELCALAYAGDERASAILDKSATLVARAASVVTNTLDVERVVFGGPFWTCLAQRYL
ncbi:MAG TPA: ROK family transcriptional regulator, partial [Arthrobacter sp.]